MKRVGQHTCSKLGGEEEVLKNAPYLSEYNESTNQIPFLGRGYYFWEENFEMAKFWGEIRYKNGYFVIEAELDLPEDVVLDLVNDRKHMKFVEKAIEKLNQKGYKKRWNLGKVIEFIKETNKIIKIIRSIDHSYTGRKTYYVVNKKNFITLNPRMVICLIEKNPLFLPFQKIIYKS